MKNLFLSSTLFCALTVNAWDSVTVRLTSPKNGSTISSPILITARATSAQSHVTLWRIYVDGLPAWHTGATSSIKTRLPVASGTHRLKIRVWDEKGSQGTAYITVKVGKDPPTNVPGRSKPTPKGVIVHITFPTASSVSSPVRFAATAASNYPIRNWHIYSDNQAIYQASTSSLNASIALSTGPHSISILASNAAGESGSHTLALNVASPSPLFTPKPTPGPSAMDFYVAPGGNDSNNGSASSPWATISHASAMARPGCTIHVAPGTYEETVVTRASGTPTARIRFQSDERWGAKIAAGTAEADWQNWGSYVDIAGFDVTGSSPNGIENLASFVRIIGNTVHDVPASCNSDGGSGINNADYSASDNDIIANLVHDVRQPAGCTAHHGVGVYQANLGGHVSNNISFHNGTVGVQLWHAANAVVVSNNTVFNNDVNGIVIGAGDSPGDVSNDNTTVSNNISVNNTYYGIQEFGSTGSHNRYLNNLVYGNPSGDITLLTGTASGTIVASPQFVNYTGTVDGDYQLSSTSPAVDAGTSVAAPATDFNGALRPYGSAWDIGAFELYSAPATWPWRF